MKLILIVVAIIEIQRLFNALVGVRPFALRDGWESCPLCRMRWRQSTRSSRVIHKCYVLLNKSERRVGDHFQDSDHASFWSKITYSWMSPFLSVALCTPFGFFGVPADVDQKKDAQTYWEVLNEATRRLPRLPADMSTRENLDNPAWALWRYQNKSKKELAELKKEGKLPDALPRQGALEGIFLWLTKPIRAVLSRAFVLFFLPSSVKKKTTTEKENPTEKSKPMKKKKGLFQLFMQHPSGKQYVYTCVPLKLAQDFLSLVAPLVVKKLVDFLRVAGMAVGDPAQGASSHFMRGLTVVAMLVVVVLLQVIIFQYYLTHLYSSSMKATGALKALISRHTLATPTAFGFQSAPKQEERLLSPVTQSPRPGSPQQPRSLSASMGRQSSPLPENAEPKKAAQGGLSKEGGGHLSPLHRRG
ncbi:hypothetical protein ADEAN_000434500 [Angomonas deanei]|uniref:Uncharacterized protein n=1 Tax=Angomonas deanei TaxID=59799 RepID=A0A7G2CD45_9TRYP|nr:hypothetical protein ADEAN_000434500 [Angomonas deanei]